MQLMHVYNASQCIAPIIELIKYHQSTCAKACKHRVRFTLSMAHEFAPPIFVQCNTNTTSNIAKHFNIPPSEICYFPCVWGNFHPLKDVIFHVSGEIFTYRNMLFSMCLGKFSPTERCYIPCVWGNFHIQKDVIFHVSGEISTHRKMFFPCVWGNLHPQKNLFFSMCLRLRFAVTKSSEVSLHESNEVAEGFPHSASLRLLR